MTLPVDARPRMADPPISLPPNGTTARAAAAKRALTTLHQVKETQRHVTKSTAAMRVRTVSRMLHTLCRFGGAFATVARRAVQLARELGSASRAFAKADAASPAADSDNLAFRAEAESALAGAKTLLSALRAFGWRKRHEIDQAEREAERGVASLTKPLPITRLTV